MRVIESTTGRLHIRREIAEKSAQSDRRIVNFPGTFCEAGHLPGNYPSRWTQKTGAAHVRCSRFIMRGTRITYGQES